VHNHNTYYSYVVGTPIGSIRRRPASAIMPVSCESCGAYCWLDNDLLTKGPRRSLTIVCRKCAQKMWKATDRFRGNKTDPFWMADAIEPLASNLGTLKYSYISARNVCHLEYLYISIGKVSMAIGSHGQWVHRLFGRDRSRKAS
jgi:hypothetical protein